MEFLLLFRRMNLLLRAVAKLPAAGGQSCHLCPSCAGSGGDRDPQPGLVTGLGHMRSPRAESQRALQALESCHVPLWEFSFDRSEISPESSWSCVGHSKRQDLGSSASSVLPTLPLFANQLFLLPCDNLFCSGCQNSCIPCSPHSHKSPAIHAAAWRALPAATGRNSGTSREYPCFESHGLELPAAPEGPLLAQSQCLHFQLDPSVKLFPEHLSVSLSCRGSRKMWTKAPCTLTCSC